MGTYKNRIVDGKLQRKLKGIGAVLIEGPKWCGKTTTAVQHAKSVLFMDEPEREKQNLQMAEVNPEKLLDGETPRLIDEWQLAPKLWDTIRYTVDHRDGEGHFILTGSAVPVENESVHHSGTGRFAWLTMRPMSLWESGDSTGEVSVNGLFSNVCNIEGSSDKNLDDIAYLVCRGGWPGTLGLDKDVALDLAFDYYDGVVRSDISRADGVSKNPERVKRLMRSYARHQGTQANIAVIGADMAGNESGSLDDDTIYSYLNALRKIFVVEDMPAWNPNLRSKTVVRTSDTRYFVDPSIATAALGIGPNDLINDLKTFGLLFETMAVRDLRVYADAIEGRVYHYRDKSGLECDAVIHLRNGKYGLVEIKIGGDKLIEEGVATLLTLSRNIDSGKMSEPSFLMVLTGIGTYAYRRTDGVYVVPIGCLKD